MTDELVEIAARALDDVFGEPVSYGRTRAILAAVTPAIEAHVTGEIVAWLQELATHTTKYSPTTIADNIESGHFAHWAETQHRGDYKESQP